MQKEGKIPSLEQVEVRDDNDNDSSQCQQGNKQ
jgi:hypothetical protein